MEEKILKPTEIDEIPFPGSTQEIGTDGDMGFPKLVIANVLKSATMDSETGIVNISGGSIGGAEIANIARVSSINADIVPTDLTVVSTTVTVASDGTTFASVILTWTPINTDTFDHYLVRYKKTANTYFTQTLSSANTVTIDGLIPNTSYDFGLASVNKYGTTSAFSPSVTQITAADTLAPATVTAGSATAGIQYVVIEWTHNTETDLASYNIYRNTSNSSATSTLIGNCRTNYFVDGGRTGGQIYYYWIKALDTSGNLSTNYSTVVSATPRNVTSDDIVTIAGSKVLIDGAVYLSNWRHTGDLTKIDGGDIYAGSVTTTQLNFTPVASTNVIASINASAEGITIDADNLTINSATTFASGYNPTDKTAKVGGTYDSAASGARVRIFPDANTGIQVIDDAGGDVFKTIVGGTDVGDVILGNYASGYGIKYDKSTGMTTFKGTIAADSIIAGAFDIGTSGYVYIDGANERIIVNDGTNDRVLMGKF